LLVAAACILAVGVASTSLDDALEDDPSDVIDTSWIPTEDNPPTTGQEVESGDEEAAERETVEGSPEDEFDAGMGERDTTVLGGGSPVMTILDYLRMYMWYIIAGIAGIVGLITAYLLYRRYFRGASSEKAEIIYDVDTSNDVYKSWWEMVEMLDADDLSTKTPQEFAEMAVEEGFDEEAVSELTETFEETLYGGREVTREQERRAREAVERIKAEGRKKNRKEAV